MVVSCKQILSSSICSRASKQNLTLSSICRRMGPGWRLMQHLGLMHIVNNGKWMLACGFKGTSNNNLVNKKGQKPYSYPPATTISVKCWDNVQIMAYNTLSALCRFHTPWSHGGLKRQYDVNSMRDSTLSTP